MLLETLVVVQPFLKRASQQSEDARPSDRYKPAVNVDFVVVHEANSSKDGDLVR